ncbi:MAG: toxic anion resistance protein [bacterium]
MSEKTTVATKTPENEVTEEQALATLQDVNTEIVAYNEANDDEKASLDEILGDLDINDTESIISFGSKAQEQLTVITDRMLEGVRSKDVGPAGSALNEMVSVMRGFDLEGLDPQYKPGFFARLFGKAKPMVKFVQQYETVAKQLDTVSATLDNHKTTLLTDIVSLDRLYEANLDYFHQLERYITAGEERLRQLDKEEIPAMETKTKSDEDVLTAQQLRDLRGHRDDLERRVHDLRLTRQVTMQSLPSIRLVQENDKALVTKINSTMTNTLPLWRQQLAYAVTIFRSGEAARTVKAASDLTNELLVKNAENLKTANAEVRRQMERGIVDIETIKTANNTLIETIEESLQIAEEGKQKRAEALEVLQSTEDELREALTAAKPKHVTAAVGETLPKIGQDKE